MLLEQKVVVRWVGKNKKHYTDLGYEFTKMFDYFTVDVQDLTIGSRVMIKIQCDYCGCIYERTYKYYNQSKNDAVTIKDACDDCTAKKREDTVLSKHGVKNVCQVEEIEVARLKTMRERYGVEYALQNNEILKKTQETNLEKYGVKNPMQSELVLKRAQRTNLKRYGFKSSFQNEDVRKRWRDNNMRKYGVEHIMYVSKFARKARINSNKCMAKDSTIKSSRQQRLIWSLVGGELNYLVDTYALDIAFPDENIYIEYDGGGHNLSIKFNQVTPAEFEIKENKRYETLESMDWRMIRIVSAEDNLPNDKTIIDMVEYARLLISQGYNSVIFDIDKGSIIYGDNTYSYNYYELRKVYKKDILAS